MKKLSLFLLTLACVFQFSAQAQERPSYIAIEANSGKLLFSSNAEEKRPVASLSQVATAMVALDWVARTRLPLDTFIAVPQEAFGLRAGQSHGSPAGRPADAPGRFVFHPAGFGQWFPP